MAFNELEFINELQEKLTTAFPNYIVYQEKMYKNLTPDLWLERENENIIIEVKYAGNYSTLPLINAIQLLHFKMKIPNSKVLLISFTDVYEEIKDVLKKNGIKTLVRPDYNKVIQEIKAI